MNVTPQQVHLVAESAAVLIAAAWVLLSLDRQRWWPSQWSLHLDAAAREARPGEVGEVVVVIPARNEASMLPRTLPRLLKQAEWIHRVVLVDDRSEDKTASCARRLAEGTEGAHLLRVERVAETAPGWTGKVYAMQRGYEAAVRDWDGDPSRQWILFTAADVLHPTFSISRFMSKLRSEEVDLLSVMVKLRARSFWEWLLIPALTYFFQRLYPFRKVSAPGSRRAAAAAGMILVRRSALEDAGGLETIRDRNLDDVALAQRIRRSGGRCWLGLDPDMRSLRTYDSYGAIHAMVTRSAFEHLGGHYLLVPVMWLVMLTMYLVPPVLAVYGGWRLDPVIAVGGALAWLLAAANYLPVVQYLGAPSGIALTLPVAAAMYAAMVTISAGRRLFGLRPDWRPARELDVNDG